MQKEVPTICMERGPWSCAHPLTPITGSFSDYAPGEMAVHLREWPSVLNDAEQRIGLYHHHLNLIEERLRPILGPLIHDHAVWEGIEGLYAPPISVPITLI